MTPREDSTSPKTLAGAWRMFFSYASPWVLITSFLAALTFRSMFPHIGIGDLLLTAGIASAWPILEWLIHVYILHARPFSIGSRWHFDSLTAVKHRDHHRHPSDLRTAFIPLHAYLLAIPLACFTFYATMPTLALTFTGLAAFFGFALHYEWVHFLVHTRYVPRTKRYRRLRQNHRRHHFKHERFWMDVSTQLGDRIFRTSPPVAQVATSPTCYSLGVPSPDDSPTSGAASGAARATKQRTILLP
ncbi:MAG: sterol desaturase family protein [Deltaproteobacteria bacterium]|nr:sterol desaturase family protein [Deltaproteobacteria bacterium]